ncbi:hypothetical protein I4U23_011383 [Adineta vaga]|nr:hypothetical protein I4U23_011383 [Adineta vaga]
MFYISNIMRDLGEIVLGMLLLKSLKIPTRIFSESFQLSINQFRCLYQKLTESETRIIKIACDRFITNILYLLYISTKINFQQNEQQQLYKLIRWINQLNIHTKFSHYTLLHLCCDSRVNINISQLEIRFLCPKTIQLLID